MSQKNTTETYVEGLKVKIGEKYKPPPKVNLSTSYSQRLMLNHQLHQTMTACSYNFNLESTIKEHLKQWRQAKKAAAEMKAHNLQRIRNEHIEQEMVKQQTQVEQKQVVSSYETILKPTQLNTVILDSSTINSNSEAKSPINISDFEIENSTPFDNLELKTINDLEELKLVLENETKRHLPGHPHTLVNTPQSVQSQYSLVNGLNGFHNHHTMANGYCGNSSYHTTAQASAVNNVQTVGQVMSYKEPYRELVSLNGKSSPPPHLQIKMSPPLQRTVTDVLHALNKDLGKSVVSNATTIECDDCMKDLDSLSKEMQINCKGIASMGFPMKQVIQACKDIGDDQKKIIDHLLALNELLDLGFLEENIRSALLKNDNDKDKALEALL